MAVFCQQCGNNMNDGARFCSACGAQLYAAGQAAYGQGGYGQSGYAQSGPVNPGLWVGQTRLIRPRAGRSIAGVCIGLANSYGWDVAWVRVITVLLAIFGGGAGLVGYIVFWVVMPEEALALPPGTTYVPPSQG